MLDAGKLRHRLKILAPVSEQNSQTGEMELEWAELATVWGSFEPYSTRDRLAAASVQDQTSVRSVIRYRDDVLPEMRILFRDRLYEIVGPPLTDADSGLEYMTLMLMQIDDIPTTTVPMPDGGYLKTNIGFVKSTLETDGDETSFEFDDTFVEGSLLVFINGILATPGDEYDEKTDRSGVDFSTAPAADDVVEVRYARAI